MATVYMPTLLEGLTGGQQPIRVDGVTVLEVIAHLDEAYPGLRERLMEGDRLRRNVAVAVDGEINQAGLLSPVGPVAEVHFVFSLKGG